MVQALSLPVLNNYLIFRIVKDYAFTSLQTPLYYPHMSPNGTKYACTEIRSGLHTNVSFVEHQIA